MRACISKVVLFGLGHPRTATDFFPLFLHTLGLWHFGLCLLCISLTHCIGGALWRIYCRTVLFSPFRLGLLQSTIPDASYIHRGR